MTTTKSFGAPGHPGVPLIFAWGIHIGLSYQRPGWKQISLEQAQREGIDRWVKWGGNLVDLFPSNKEAHFTEYNVENDSAVPLHCYREHSDADQEHRWTVDEFQAFNRYAHDHDFLVSWMIHTWWPLPYEERARVFWRLYHQLGREICDVLADGFGHHIDGYMAEGDFIVPEEANDLLWPYHPGLYLREAAWGLNKSTANYIQPRGFHLTDGRTLMYEREEYMGLAPECWRGFEQIWRGEEVRVEHGRLFVSLQAEGRDLRCDEESWAQFGGMATVDMLLEQVNNYARAKGRGWTTTGTTAVRVINEHLLSPRMKRYMAGICSDPVRCAVAVDLAGTGSDGRYPRTEYPADTWVCQNNHFRLYVGRESAGVDLHWDESGQGNYTNFVWNTSRPVLDDLVETRFDETQQLTFHECRALEEAGAVACLQQRIELRAGAVALSELRDYRAEADNRWLGLRVQRVFVGSVPTADTETMLRLNGYELSVCDDSAGDIGTDRVLLFTKSGQPAIAIFIPDNPQVTRVTWDPQGVVAIRCGAAPSHDFRLLIAIDPPDVAAVDLESLARFQDQPIERDMDGGSAAELSVPASDDAATVCAVRIHNPSEGPYWVCEGGWWHVRGAQPSRQRRATDLLKVVLPAGETARIRPYGFLEGAVKNAWGCQYTQLLRDIVSDESSVRLTVRVVDINPKIWAPRVRFHRRIASAQVDGQDWRYFDGPTLFLPNHRRDYRAEVTFGTPAAPHAICTFASVESMEWDESTLAVRTALPEWADSIPDGSQYYLMVAAAGRTLDDVAGGRVVRTVPEFQSIRPLDIAGRDGVATLIPRDFNHPPVGGFSIARGHVVSYRPGVEVRLTYRDEASARTR